MIVVRVELHSAVTGRVTELARLLIDNIGGTPARRDYRVRSLRGRSKASLDRRNVQREARVLGHPSPREHVWNLIAKALAAAGYGPASSTCSESELQAQAAVDQQADLLELAAE